MTVINLLGFKELHNVCSSPIIIIVIKSKEDEMGGACSTNGEKRKAYRILVGEPEGKRPLGTLKT
jgi:hypothetical protein